MRILLIMETVTPYCAASLVPTPRSEVDARKGKVVLTSVPKAGAPPETATFYDGLFIVNQIGDITELRLSEKLTGCKTSKAKSAAAAAKKTKKKTKKAASKPRAKKLTGKADVPAANVGTVDDGADGGRDA